MPADGIYDSEAREVTFGCGLEVAGRINRTGQWLAFSPGGGEPSRDRALRSWHTWPALDRGLALRRRDRGALYSHTLAASLDVMHISMETEGCVLHCAEAAER